MHAEVWATDTIPADLPPMVEFKKKADAIIKERWGIEVEHVCAGKTYDDVFYSKHEKGDYAGMIRGFPLRKGAWCNDRLKMKAIKNAEENQNMVIGGGILL